MPDLILIALLCALQGLVVLFAYRAGRTDGSASGAKRNLETIALWRATLADWRAREQVLCLLATTIQEQAPHLITHDLVEKMAAINGSDEVN